MRLTYEPASEPLHISVELLAKGFAIRTEIVCGFVFKAHRLCVSLNSRLESNKEEEEERIAWMGCCPNHDRPFVGVFKCQFQNIFQAIGAPLGQKLTNASKRLQKRPPDTPTKGLLWALVAAKWMCVCARKREKNREGGTEREKERGRDRVKERAKAG